MRTRILLGLGLVLVLSTLRASSQGPVVLHDPLAKLPETSHTDTDERFVKEKLLLSARTLWSEEDSCNGADLNVIGAADGAFTRAGAKQRAIVYEMCQTGNGFANNGVAVLENGKAVAHFATAGGWNLEVSRVPDINRNGRDELAIETGGGMHQGYMGSSVTLLEMSETSAAELGVFLVYTNECEDHAPEKYCDRSYRLTANPGTRPSYVAQKFLNRGTDEKPRWVASGKPVAAKPIGDLNRKYELVK